ncbi:Transcriptional regulatory protein YehT [compost metagenome]
MKVLLVDDERLALMQLERMLKELDDIEVVGAFLDPTQALQMASSLQPDVVFMDIQMPEINGLQAAERLQPICPQADIVFVTAYDEYALQAFDLNAVDYVLKPLLRARLAKTVDRLKRRRGRVPEPVVDSVKPVLIRCFHTLQVEYPQQMPEALKWRTSKAQELFVYMLHHRGQLVRRGMLLEMLWPDYDQNKANTHLHTTIYQVRQCLKKAVIDIHIQSMSAEDGYMLDAKGVRIDVFEWEQELRMLETIDRDNISKHQQLLELYRGAYLADYEYIWVENERERLRLLWIQHAQRLAEYYSNHQNPMEAVKVYQRIQQQYPYYEESYLALMKLYDWLEERASVEEQYRRLNVMLVSELDLSPQEKIVEWYSQWKQRHAHARVAGEG